MLFSKEILKQFNIVDWSYTEEMAPSSLNHYHKWVDRGDHGDLGYLADHRKELRSSLVSVYPAAKSALVFLFSYESIISSIKELKKDTEYNGLNIASYALAYDGNDYHYVLKNYLEQLGEHLKKQFPALTWKLSLDVHPVLERDLAYRSGLGFFGKNSMLISTEKGSYFLIGSLILDSKLPEQAERELVIDHCGSCRACVEACPTDAIDEDSRTLIANKCISTFTIEQFKDDVEAPLNMNNASGEIFGCDICQDVCPWNKRRERLGLLTSQALGNGFRDISSFFLLQTPRLLIEKLKDFSNTSFKKSFSQTPFGRTGRVGLMKNIKYWLSLK